MKRLLLFSLLLATTSASAQDASRAPRGRHPEEGRPLIRNIAPEEYGGGGQNWDIVQDSRGVLYVGATGGVLEHDGASWRLIETPSRGTVRSLALERGDRVYVGGVSDLGYLAPDSIGTLHFVSLRDRIPADARTFGDVWRTFVLSDGVYFQTESALYRWANDTMRVWKPRVRFNRASVVDGRLYLTQPDLGLMVLDGETFRALPGTATLANEPFAIVLRYDTGRLLIGTRRDGLFLYDGTTLAPLPTEVDALIKSSNLYRGLIMPDGTFGLMTTLGGFVVVDRAGRRVQVLNRQMGLGSDVVYNAMFDREGALWLARAPGLSRVEIPSPVSFFGEDEGLEGGVVRIQRHQGRLYVASGLGASYLEPTVAIGDIPRFVRVEGVRNQCWWFLSVVDSASTVPSEFLLACSEGLYRIDGGRAIPIKLNTAADFGAAVLLQSTRDPARVWVGLFNGLASFRRTGGEWIYEGRIDGITDQVRSLHENADGSLWAGTAATGVLRLMFGSSLGGGAPRPLATIERFGTEQGLPAGGIEVQTIDVTPLFLIAGDEPYVARFNDSTRAFERDQTFEVVGVNLRTARFGLEGGPNGDVYVNYGRGTAVMRKAPDGSWAVDRKTFGRFGETGAFAFYVEPDGVAWFTAPGRLVRFDMTRVSNESRSFAPLIRRVAINQAESLFGGAGVAGAPELNPSVTTLRFEYASPTFVPDASVEYQSRLEGLDDDWAAWTHETRRDYTNLGFGDYTFRVRARDFSGQVSEGASYAFTILPPWYRTWWAYGLYLALLVMGLFAVDRVQRRRVVTKERERAQFAEAKFRAEAAEAIAKSESERKKNVELISEIGREITASLDFDTIFGKLYERVNQLADADVFGVGLYHPEKQHIEYRLAIERGVRYAPYTRDTTDRNQLPVWCIEHREPVFINDIEQDYRKYIERIDEQSRKLEDGTMSGSPQSVIYLSLVSKDRVLGIITIQSFEKNAYSEHDLNMMQSLAAFVSVALDNANAYRQLNDQEHEIRRLFEEAERARSIAEEADAAKSSFLSTVSHELRTPLTSVLGFAKIIKKRLEERIFPLIQTEDRRIQQTMQQVQENLQVVVSEGERLTKLIDDVLDLAKIEAGKLEWHMDGVAVDDIIEHATAATSSLFEQSGLKLVKQVPANLPIVIGDRDRLIQVVINLISNAVKFTEQGFVTCRAERRGGEIIISVIDTGMGIAEADQPKVFERFKQVGDTLTDKPKGTGLGLPISREIIEHHGGRIWVESEPGKGSTFSFALPVTADTRASTPVDLAAIVRQLREHVVVSTPRIAERAPRILVVDDDANIRELLTQEFVEAGYQVTVASNGREAVTEVRRHRPDLIVLDVMMPEMNGFDVAAVLKNDPATADIPIIILSIVQDKERGFRLGVDRYLTKPIDTNLLFKEVGELIGQQKSHRRVLIVDDDASTVKTLTDVLKVRGYSVSEARDADLFEKAKSLQPDIIMLNSVSPRPDVVQMLRFEKGLENVLFLVYQ